MSDVLVKVREFLEPLLEGTDMFIVDIRMKPVNNIKIFLDADSGLNIGSIASINRKLHYQMDEAGLYPEGDYSLEVSSPGVDEPLTGGIRQYKKNLGRTVLVTLNDDSEQLGVLKDLSEEQLVLEVKINKKKETALVEIPFANIKTTVVQIIF